MTPPPIDSETLEHQIFGSFGERLAALEARSARAEALAESAEKERARQGKEIAELRNEQRANFEDLRKDLKPLVMIASAGKFAIVAFLAFIPAAVGLITIAEKAWAWIAQR